MEEVVGEVHALRAFGTAGNDDGEFVARLADALEEVAGDDDICERRVVVLLAVVEFER